MPLCIPSYPPDHSDHLPHTQASPTYIKTLPDLQQPVEERENLCKMRTALKLHIAIVLVTSVYSNSVSQAVEEKSTGRQIDSSEFIPWLTLKIRPERV